MNDALPLFVEVPLAVELIVSVFEPVDRPVGTEKRIRVEDVVDERIRLGANTVASPLIAIERCDTLLVIGKLVSVAWTTVPWLPEVGETETELSPDGFE